MKGSKQDATSRGLERDVWLNSLTTSAPTAETWNRSTANETESLQGLRFPHLHETPPTRYEALERRVMTIARRVQRPWSGLSFHERLA